MGFVQKLEIFLSFYLRQHKPGQCVVRYSTDQKAFLGYKNQNLIKSKNEHFFEGF